MKLKYIKYQTSSNCSYANIGWNRSINFSKLHDQSWNEKIFKFQSAIHSLLSRIDDEVKKSISRHKWCFSVHIDCKTIRFVFVVARRLVVCCRRSRYRHSHYTLFSSLLLFCHLPNVKENDAMLCFAVLCCVSRKCSRCFWIVHTIELDERQPDIAFPPWRHRSFIVYVVCVRSSTMKKFAELAHLRTCNLSCIMSHLFHRLNTIEMLRQRKDPIFEMRKIHLNFFARVIGVIYFRITRMCVSYTQCVNDALIKYLITILFQYKEEIVEIVTTQIALLS